MSYFSALGFLKTFFKVKSRANISNAAFSATKLTAALLLACSVLTTSKQFFGDPIHCHIDSIGKTVTLKVYESYCFMSGTYTLLVDNAADNTTLLHHGGVGHGTGKDDPRNVHHNYYQWVCLVLFLQAASCYLPWYAWKAAEGGRVSKLLARVSEDPLTETSDDDQVANLGDFLLSHRGWFNAAAIKLLLCQAACLLNALGQLYLMDLLLGGRFLFLGTVLADYTALQRALRVVFPRIVMCNMQVFGVSGSTTGTSGICVLPINIINEKIYLVLWMWFLGLTLLSLLQLVRQAALLVASLRTCLSPGLSSSLTSPRQVRQLVTRGSYGDTVLLQLIAANCDGSQFAALVQLLVREQRLQDSYVSQQLHLSRGAGRDYFHQDLLPSGKAAKECLDI